MSEREIAARRIKNLQWGRYLWLCSLISGTIEFCLFYGTFLRLGSALGFDVQRGEAIFDYHIHRLEDLFDDWSALIAEAEQAGGVND
jgi:hypothetical protein